MTRLIVPILLVGLSACGGDDPTTSDAGLGAEDGPGGMAACPTGASTGDGALTFAGTSVLFAGEVILCGTASLPPEAQADRPAQLLLYRLDEPGNEFLLAGTLNEVKRVHFAVALAAGSYRVGLRTDDTGDAQIGSGDLQGFFDGTVAAPKIDEAEGATIELVEARDDVEFGLGRLP